MIDISIIGTHQTRLRCMLSQFYGEKVERFKNGSVIRIELMPRYISIKLIYSGEIGLHNIDKKYYYYIKRDEIRKNKVKYFKGIEYTENGERTTGERFHHIKFIGNKIIIKPVKLGFYTNTHKNYEIDTKGKNNIFYFIVNGESENNVMGNIEKTSRSTLGPIGNSLGFKTTMYDSELTSTGIKQIQNTARFLMKNKEFMRSRYVFSSDMYVTIQTLTTILNTSKIKNIKNINVLPCIHEVEYHKSGICDQDNYLIGYVDKTKCTDISNDDKCIKKLNGYNIIWKEYFKFYKGTRMDWLNILSTHKCSDHNAINIAIKMINTNPNKKSGGSKKTFRRPSKVTVTYKNKKKSIPKKYVRGLKGKERKAQIKSIFEGTDRPKTSAKEKRSQWVVKFEKKYNKKITNKSWIHKNIISKTGQEKIINKGIGAYYSSGSRPNQTGESWAYARLASVIMNGPARKYDMDIWQKYKK